MVGARPTKVAVTFDCAARFCIASGQLGKVCRPPDKKICDHALFSFGQWMFAKFQYCVLQSGLYAGLGGVEPVGIFRNPISASLREAD